MCSCACVYPHACSHVSTYMLPYIVVVYPHAGAMYPHGGFGYALWASADSLAMRFGLVDRMWLCAMGQCAEFGYALWTSAQNNCPWRRIT
jgi:hypothetical protein